MDGRDTDDEAPTLGEHLEQERLRRKMKWAQVAREMGMTPGNLARIRKNEINVSPDAESAIEKFMRWEKGSIQDVLAGRHPTSLGISPERASSIRDDESATWGRDAALLYREIRQRRGREAANAFLFELMDDEDGAADADPGRAQGLG
ncbi:helix-turn-helix transcriptional regulator [Amycolatopsis sp. CA-230715]|uniref:helix-turn-helix transcriptional regulator n=1 Tax=Amycolatopsis sp. CA-230715 TaxID=2745196 RepID=UPI001C0352D2|nr:helix-turn-helix transcriptional regulator [Amycolatopsis sp. CA-230715]QWF81163.1 hypothetical protein HUW46_04589 [Amycolatopsis sp. CA-230715]